MSNHGQHQVSARRRRRTGVLFSVVLAASLLLTTLAPAQAAPAQAQAAQPASAEAGTAVASRLPFELPPTNVLRSSPKKVFANWAPTLPISLDNKAPASDYYAVDYLQPRGEGGIHARYGGFLRDRPLPRAPLAGDWRLQDMQTEVRQAISVGIDGFTVDLYALGNAPTSHAWVNAVLMMQAAASVDPGFKIIVMPDMTGAVGKASPAVLAQYVAELGRSASAYRLGDGRLVVSPFTAEVHDVAWWRQFLDIMATTQHTPVAFLPLFQNEQIWRTQFAPISYGMANWGSRNPAWNSPTIPYSTYPLGRAAAVQRLGKVWMQPVSAQDERPRAGLYDEAQNTTNLRNTWQIAIDGHAQLVQLATWNDYPEGSQLAPSVANGWSYLDISAYYLTWFKTGQRPPVVRDTVYLTSRVQPYAARPSFPQTTLMTLRGGSPSRDTIEALTFLTAPGTVTIHAGNSTATCAVPAGVGMCTVPLHTGTLSATVSRNGATVAQITSTHPVTDNPTVQDLHYYADSSRR